MRYRRSNTPGGTFFFTVNLEDRAKRTLVERIDTLRASVRYVKVQHPFDIIAWVVLPEHLHAIWSLPPDDGDFSTRWMLIKAGFSRRVERAEAIGASRLRKGERGIWQRRFWEHQIRDDQDLQRHVDYLHAWARRTRGSMAMVVDSSLHSDGTSNGGLGRRRLHHRTRC